MDRVVLQELLSEGLSLAEIGRRFDRHEATVAYWLKRHGLEAVGRERHAAKGALTRSQLQPLIEAGMSIAQIAEAVGRSKATLRHWLKRYGLKTAAASGRRRTIESERAKRDGLIEADMCCSRHGETRFVLDQRGYYRCARCRSAAVSKRRRRLKAILVEEAGGVCRLCGYSRCLAALEFHHLVPGEKGFALSQHGVTRSLARARAEASKCVLLCANCHAEVEVGATSLTDEECARVQCPESPGAHPG